MIAEAALRSWNIDPWFVVPLCVGAWIYTRGWRQLHRQMPRHFASWRLLAFLSGVGIIFVAIASPLDAFGGLLLHVHMAQHLLLMMVAPPLIWLGQPVVPMLRGMPPPFVKLGLGPFLAWPALRRLGRAVSHPAVCWVAFVAGTWIWHLPALYELALRSPGWHQLEHACFLGTALLFWWPVVQPWPSGPVWPRWTMIPYLVLADVQNTAFSAIFAFAERAIYPVYGTVPRLWGISVLDDQAAAGALMWVPGSVAYVLPIGLLIGEILSPPRQVRPGDVLGPGSDAAWVPGESTPPVAATRSRSVVGHAADRGAWDLLSVPVLGAIVRWRHFRRVAQTVMLLLAAVIVVDGLLGPQMSPMNLAGVLPWTYWRGLVVVTLLVAGNVFCMACPFMVPRDLGRRIFSPRRHWPKPLRSKWLAVGLLVLYLCAYEAFSLWDSPWWTAWIVVGYFAAAFTVDGLFRGASFCKYLCPIGQFNFIHSTVSPLEVKVKAPDVCARCTTHDCIRGNARQRGCELELFQPEKVGNLDCTFCLDCVHACPHANVGVLAVVPGSDLAADPFRSSLRRLSRRTDVAVLVLVLVFGAFANAAGMVTPVLEWQERVAARIGPGMPRWIVSGLIVLSLAVGPVLLAALCAWGGRMLGRVELPQSELFSRFALSLVPLGFSMWLAHFVFHVLAGAGTAIPVIQRVAMDLHVGWLGAPAWGRAAAGSGHDWMLASEILVLDCGLLLTLYIGWRIALSYVRFSGGALCLMIPWAGLAVGLYAVGVWVIFQPMQMRGTMMH